MSAIMEDRDVTEHVFKEQTFLTEIESIADVRGEFPKGTTVISTE